uniref:Cystatin like 1 n=1 Tax=Molossus molossus TaxID=27622 RepID=A0A7J8HFG5_MOLMO|nr:cystatin like 1 [Molossus molossus]
MPNPQHCCLCPLVMHTENVDTDLQASLGQSEVKPCPLPLWAAPWPQRQYHPEETPLVVMYQ